MAAGMDPRSPVNRGWRRGWTPDPRQIGDGTAIPDPRQIGDGGGDGDRGFRALGPSQVYYTAEIQDHEGQAKETPESEQDEGAEMSNLNELASGD